LVEIQSGEAAVTSHKRAADVTPPSNLGQIQITTASAQGIPGAELRGDARGAPHRILDGNGSFQYLTNMVLPLSFLLSLSLFLYLETPSFNQLEERKYLLYNRI